jgi:hypothetical protein
VAVKIAPPTAGRMKVCTASLRWSTTGILSSTSSQTSSTAPIPSTHPLASQRCDAGRSMTLVKGASMPTVSSGM